MKGYLVVLSLGLPLGPPLVMDIINTLGYLLEYLNTVDVLGSLFGYMYIMILINPSRSLLGSLVGISPGALLSNWVGYLLDIFPG